VFNRYLKAVDSYLVQEYYIDTVNNLEYIVGFNISDGSNNVQAGLTTIGRSSGGTYSSAGEKLLDYVLILNPTDTAT
jgi:hypothetical protein